MDVSVICPVFNTHPTVLEAAARSVLDQAGPHAVELILVDDASASPVTQTALDALAAADSRVRVIRQAANGGPAVARMTGIAAARHGWIGFVDSDDLWPPGKLDQAAAVVQDRPDTRWIGGNYATLRHDGSLEACVRPSLFHAMPQAGLALRRLSAPDLTTVLIKDWMPLGANLVRRDLIGAAGGFEPHLRYGEDWLLCLRMSTLAPMDYLHEQTYLLRRQGVSLMRSPGRMSALLTYSVKLVRRDPMLRAVRRQLWWYDYATHKDVAMNNALNGRRLRALGWALRALAPDPRESGEFLLFVRMLGKKQAAMAAGLRRYSTAEQVILSQLAEQGGATD